MTISIDAAQPQDLPEILRLLARHDLPHAGLADHLDSALVARDGVVVGCAALELYEGSALLRSVAVSPELQDQGLGGRLTTAALDMARRHDVQRVYLLTTTAEDYFPRFGFRRIARAEVAPAVHASAEFRGACPESAAVLALDLD